MNMEKLKYIVVGFFISTSNCHFLMCCKVQGPTKRAARLQAQDRGEKSGASRGVRVGRDHSRNNVEPVLIPSVRRSANITNFTTTRGPTKANWRGRGRGKGKSRG